MVLLNLNFANCLLSATTSKMNQYTLFPYHVTIVFLSLAFLLFYIYVKRLHSYWERRGVEYEKPVFLIGSLWMVFSGKKQVGKYFGELYRKFKGPYFGIYICGKPYLVVRHPEIIKNITMRDFHNFGDRSFACDKEADNMSGNSLFIIRNPDWRNIRNKLSGIFTSGKIKQMYPIMTRIASEMQRYLEKHDGEIMEVKNVAGSFTTDLVAECFFGIESNSFSAKEDQNFKTACSEMLNLNLYRAFRLFCYFFLPPVVSVLKLKLLDTTYLQKVFMETLRIREKTGFIRHDFVDLLISVRDNFQSNYLEKGVHFDTTCMVAQAITFFTAGFETTSNLMGFVMYELSFRQDCQDKLRQEIIETFQNEESEITFDKIQQMQYLDMVIAETLRRYPFGPFLNRVCKEDYIIKETGLKMEKGTVVLIPLDGIHYDPTYYKDPDKFEPERFRDGYKNLLNNCVYMPFGLGPRNCIGERFALIGAKVGLIHLIRKFKVEKCHLTEERLELDPKSPFLIPIKGLQLRVTKI